MTPFCSSSLQSLLSYWFIFSLKEVTSEDWPCMENNMQNMQQNEPEIIAACIWQFSASCIVTVSLYCCMHAHSQWFTNTVYYTKNWIYYLHHCLSDQNSWHFEAIDGLYNSIWILCHFQAHPLDFMTSASLVRGTLRHTLCHGSGRGVKPPAEHAPEQHRKVCSTSALNCGNNSSTVCQKFQFTAFDNNQHNTIQAFLQKPSIFLSFWRETIGTNCSLEDYFFTSYSF